MTYVLVLPSVGRRIWVIPDRVIMVTAADVGDEAWLHLAHGQVVKVLLSPLALVDRLGWVSVDRVDL